MTYANRVVHDALAHEIGHGKVTTVRHDKDERSKRHSAGDIKAAKELHQASDHVERHHRVSDAHRQREEEENGLLYQR